MTPRVDPSRVLVIRTDKIGDLILTLPAVRAIRRAYPRAELTLLVSPYNAPVVRDWPVPDRVELYDQGWPIGRRLTTARALRARRFDLCVVLHPTLEAFLVARLTGAPVRAGRVHARVVFDRLLAPLLLTDRCLSQVERDAARRTPVEHEVTASRRALETIGVPWADDDLELPRSPEADSWADVLLAQAGLDGTPPIGVHLSPKWFDSGWTPRQLAGLLTQLASPENGGAVIATHGPDDGATAGQVMEAAGCRPAPWPTDPTDVQASPDGRVLVVAVDFPRLAAVTARCRMVVSRDTGSLHVASAAGRPVVAVYAPARFDINRQQFAPWRVPSVSLCDGPFDALVPAIVGAVRELSAACASAPTKYGAASNAPDGGGEAGRP